MSAWGTGIKQSDEFLDVYEDFFERYQEGSDPREIAADIWKEYCKEFPDTDNDPILFTVRYAIASCLWECGKRDEKLWTEINNIIVSGSDLRFWEGLTDSKTLIKRRKKALDEFWKKINTVPTKIRKPQKSGAKRLPTLHKGDVFAYRIPNGGYRAAVVFDFVWDCFLIALCDESFNEVPEEKDVWKCKTGRVFWTSQRNAIPKKDRIIIGHKEIVGDYNGRAGLIFTDKLVGCSSYATRDFFYDAEAAGQCMKRNGIGKYVMEELLDPKVLPKY